ncbi:hypothetical protein LUZ61_016721 [Rhynchospora tenuis]|uniref:Uncharacterized protein n=2 Tax=Rhynchospora tenuis TaxID=198213 RepID=A0AAD6EKA8_9POAL|nr:hypothetical protein LUZ61_016721 [Rhynchospora tenuis]
MLQFPAMMRQFPATPILPTTTLLPVVAVPQEEEMLLSMAESELEEKLNDIRKAHSNLVIIGKAGSESYKEEMEADGEDEEGEHVDESDAEDFEQETGTGTYETSIVQITRWNSRCILSFFGWKLVLFGVCWYHINTVHGSLICLLMTIQSFFFFFGTFPV